MRKYGGIGLGFNISNNLFKLMGFLLMFESELEWGFIFFFDVMFVVVVDIDVLLFEII